jgi:hypothetical protein
MEPRSPSPMVRWLLPDLSLLLVAVTLFYALVLYHAPTQLFRDSDAGWHIRNGDLILSSGSVPHTDPWSFSKPGEPWFAWEWGADVVMAWAHQRAGLRGVVLLYLVLIAFASWLWMRLQWVYGGSFGLAALFAAPLLTTVQLHWLARPHVFGWVCLLLALYCVERARYGWLLPLAVLWANLHGSFILLPGLLICYGFRHRRCWLWALGCGAATLLNPYGWHVHAHIWSYLRNTELLSRIAEFQSFNFHTDGAGQVMVALLLVMAGAVCALQTGRWPHALWMLGLVALALRSARGLPVLALAGLPMANAALSSALAVRWPEQFAYFARLRNWDRQVHGGALAAVLAVVFGLAALGSTAQFPPAQFPVAALAHVPPTARLLAPDAYGGYLIYRGRNVYFDGRSDYYGAEFMKEYVRLVEVRPGYRAILEKYRFTHALLPVRYSLVEALTMQGWRELYRDEVSVLLERNF